MELKIIKTKKEHLVALERFEEIFNAKAGTKESNEGDMLSLLIQNYENKHFVIKAPTPLEAIKYRVEKQGEFILHPLHKDFLEFNYYVPIVGISVILIMGSLNILFSYFGLVFVSK